MATRSLIAIKNNDGSIESIYCHNNGYPSYNGQILLNHYNDENRIRELLSLGDLSVQGSKIKPEKEYDHIKYSLFNNKDVDKKYKHSFETPHKDVTVAYHRDRGEELNISKYSSESEWCDEDGEDFNYLWKDGKWYVNGDVLTEEMVK